MASVSYQWITPEFQVFTENLLFPEGPVVLPDGSVLVVEINGKTLKHVAPDGQHRVLAELEGGPNGAAIGPDGCCYICNSGGWIHQRHEGLLHVARQSETHGWIEKVDLETGEVTRLYTECEGRPLSAPNDLVFDRHGGFYFTDHGTATAYHRTASAVFYALADGSEIREVARPLLSANGIGLSADGATLFVAETQPRRMLRFALQSPGVIDPAPFPSRHGGELVAGLPDNYALDSLAIDSADHICVGSIGSGGVWDISPCGLERSCYALPDPYVTNICFGGKDQRTAYLTLSGAGRIVTMEWPRPGLPLPYLPSLIPGGHQPS